MKHDEFFRKHPVFTGEELAAYLSLRGETGTRTQEGVLAHQIKSGRLVRIRRGLFAVVPPGADWASYPVDPFLVAGKLTADAVLSHHTALEFHGRAYSVQGYFTYSASNPIGPVTFRSHVFRGTTFPSALTRAGKERYEVLTAERAGMELRVTSLERTMVDVPQPSRIVRKLGGDMAVPGIDRVLQPGQGHRVRALSRKRNHGR